ncbi:MAG TPA: hypothetical protein VGW74_02345 [Propionibacteriaceae bacterium]|nr:hypothetical protein [Propionibacteriaceae bacterium]
MNHERVERRPDLSQRPAQRLALAELGDVDLQHQQRDDDGEDTVGQGENPRGIVGALQHGLGLLFTLPRPADLDFRSGLI